MTAARSLDRVLAALDLPPHAVQAFDPGHPDFDAQRPLLVLPPQFEAARPLLRLRYPPAAVARALEDGVPRETPAAALPLHADAWLLPALPPEEDARSLRGLRGVMERLFAPDGCPWDREQTHETLRPFLLEETYELVDAIDRQDMAGLREEVGDLLAHMFMQTALAQQSGAFRLEDAVEHAVHKFVRRHPHVFGDEEATSAEELLGRWEEIKAGERAARDEGAARPEGALDSVPAAAPALQRLQTLLRRAARAGLAPPPASPGEAARDALEAGDPLALLVAAVRAAAEAGVDAEEALRAAAGRFTRAFEALEGEARARGTAVESLGLDRRAEPWRALGGQQGGPPAPAQ